MKHKGTRILINSIILILLFALWTILVINFDVKPIGVKGTWVGFSQLNKYFHNLTGVNMTLYNITDWLGLVPLFVCFIFAILGLTQLIKRKSLFKVDMDIALLGVYYIIVIFSYLVFEMIPINYRPILINGFMEASYPSSTTLLVLGVMPTLNFQINKRIKNSLMKNIICFISGAFSVFMVFGRLISGVHWFSDIIGSVLLSMGLYYLYKASAVFAGRNNNGIR